MVRFRPSSSLPFRALMALSPSESLGISTNPKPLDRPVSRSVTMLTRSTGPYASNMERTASSVAPKVRFPTKIFLIEYPSELEEQRIGQESEERLNRTMRKLPKSAVLLKYITTMTGLPMRRLNLFRDPDWTGAKPGSRRENPSFFVLPFNVL